MCCKLYRQWSQFRTAIIKWKCTLQKEEVLNRLGWQHGLIPFQSVNWKCVLDLRKQHWQLKMHFRVEETGKLQWFKGQILNYDPTSGQYGVFPSANHLLIRQYTCIQMTRMSSSWTSCSLCISCWSSQHFVYSYWFMTWWHVSIDFRSYVHSNSHPMMIWITHCEYLCSQYAIHNRLWLENRQEVQY